MYILMMKRKKQTSKPTKSVSDTLKTQEALTLFFNTCNYKFNYWFRKELMPIYYAKGTEHVTPVKINKTIDKFKLDVKTCVNSKILKKLLDDYFNSDKSIDIFLNQYFNNKIDEFELKNFKNFSISNKTIEDISKEPRKEQ